MSAENIASVDLVIDADGLRRTGQTLRSLEKYMEQLRKRAGLMEQLQRNQILEWFRSFSAAIGDLFVKLNLLALKARKIPLILEPVIDKKAFSVAGENAASLFSDEFRNVRYASEFAEIIQKKLEDASKTGPISDGSFRKPFNDGIQFKGLGTVFSSGNSINPSPLSQAACCCNPSQSSSKSKSNDSGGDQSSDFVDNIGNSITGGIAYDIFKMLGKNAIQWSPSIIQALTKKPFTLKGIQKVDAPVSEILKSGWSKSIKGITDFFRMPKISEFGPVVEDSLVGESGSSLLGAGAAALPFLAAGGILVHEGLENRRKEDFLDYVSKPQYVPNTTLGPAPKRHWYSPITDTLKTDVFTLFPNLAPKVKQPDLPMQSKGSNNTGESVTGGKVTAGGYTTTPIIKPPSVTSLGTSTGIAVPGTSLIDNLKGFNPFWKKKAPQSTPAPTDSFVAKSAESLTATQTQVSTSTNLNVQIPAGAVQLSMQQKLDYDAIAHEIGVRMAASIKQTVENRV